MTRKMCLVLGALWMGTVDAAPRIAVHPLDVGPMAADERAKLQAGFEVMLARTAGIRLAGSRLDDALENEAGKVCAQRDSCLRFIAEATDSLYGCYVSIRLDALGNVSASGRVVRSDGEVVRKATTVTASVKGRSVAEAGREALSGLLDQFALALLPDAIPVAVPQPALVTSSEVAAPPPVAGAAPPPLAGVTPPAVTPVARQRSALRPVLGWSLVGLGGAGLLSGGVLSGIASSTKAGLGADASGVVPEGKAEAAAGVVRQSRFASALLAAGGTAAIAGLLVALWPAGSDAQVQLTPSVDGSGASLVLVGRMP